MGTVLPRKDVDCRRFRRGRFMILRLVEAETRVIFLGRNHPCRTQKSFFQKTPVHFKTSISTTITATKIPPIQYILPPLDSGM